MRKNKHERLIKFKKEFWQKKDAADYFINSTDIFSHSPADIMNNEINTFFLSHCNNKEKVLDVGCGNGIVSEFLAENGMNLTSLDISNHLLNNFKERISGKELDINIINGDAYNINFPKDTFDVVVSRMFLPHFPDWPVILKEMSRVTKKKGKILIHIFSKENSELSKKIEQNTFSYSLNNNINDPKSFCTEVSEKELKKISKRLNLKIIERKPVSFFYNNKLFGYQLGTEKYNNYQNRLKEYFKDERIKEFVLWFGKEVISNCVPALSYDCVIAFEKVK